MDDRELLQGLGAATELWCVTGAVVGEKDNPATIRFKRVSDAFANLLGYSAEELLSRPYQEFLHPAERERLSGVSTRVRDPDSPFLKTVVRYRKSNGKSVHLDFHSRKVGAFVFSVVRDITEEFRAKAEVRMAMATLREIASHDSLTGLFNRRMYDELFQREMQRAARSYRPLSLLALDVDHFKRLNDTHGHDVGDKALKAVADCMRRTVRVVDLLFRVGGEELAVVLPECPSADAHRVASRIVEEVRDCTAVPSVRMTISAGCVTFPDHAVELTALSKAADVALYAAKAAGRDQVCIPLQHWCNSER